jgi:hypothetical protein
MLLENGRESIAVNFTDKKLSPHAGSAVFWKFLHPSGFISQLKELLPHRLPESNNAIQPIDKAVAFIQGLLCGAEKLAHVAYLRRDPVVPTITGIKRVSSQSTLSRFFAVFDSAGKNQHCFGPMWEWCIKRVKARKEGYSLDFDSTRLLHEDGHQEGVKTGYTRVGLKPCLHPLLAVLEEAKLVAGFWLRPGNTSCANNIEGFTLEVLGRPSGSTCAWCAPTAGFARTAGYRCWRDGVCVTSWWPDSCRRCGSSSSRAWTGNSPACVESPSRKSSTMKRVGVDQGGSSSCAMRSRRRRG